MEYRGEEIVLQHVFGVWPWLGKSCSVKLCVCVDALWPAAPQVVSSVRPPERRLSWVVLCTLHLQRRISSVSMQGRVRGEGSPQFSWLAEISSQPGWCFCKNHTLGLISDSRGWGARAISKSIMKRSSNCAFFTWCWLRARESFQKLPFHCVSCQQRQF